MANEELKEKGRKCLVGGILSFDRVLETRDRHAISKIVFYFPVSRREKLYMDFIGMSNMQIYEWAMENGKGHLASNFLSLSPEERDSLIRERLLPPITEDEINWKYFKDCLDTKNKEERVEIRARKHLVWLPEIEARKEMAEHCISDSDIEALIREGNERELAVRLVSRLEYVFVSPFYGYCFSGNILEMLNEYQDKKGKLAEDGNLFQRVRMYRNGILHPSMDLNRLEMKDLVKAFEYIKAL